ncbi:hypothetical protein CXG81DRAFT_25712 [Caulochytrium protostelioides]|uniref:Uncharacterized protein n=1 Tax=Caulochytrium protostelioides TaxID=1555241 RepID=A0A4P9X8L0_9FUNG|nr:hypothetical protein CXG81DRAFT_25712 [Caulochytrium protostelioides]|eukprot:RKP01616.1 hypothetical protein CXG81DRAFT_25712 [Caulochytrium protostelioides]
MMLPLESVGSKYQRPSTRPPFAPASQATTTAATAGPAPPASAPTSAAAHPSPRSRPPPSAPLPSALLPSAAAASTPAGPYRVRTPSPAGARRPSDGGAAARPLHTARASRASSTMTDLSRYAASQASQASQAAHGGPRAPAAAAAGGPPAGAPPHVLPSRLERSSSWTARAPRTATVGVDVASHHVRQPPPPPRPPASSTSLAGAAGPAHGVPPRPRGGSTSAVGLTGAPSAHGGHGAATHGAAHGARSAIAQGPITAMAVTAELDPSLDASAVANGEARIVATLHVTMSEAGVVPPLRIRLECVAETHTAATATYPGTAAATAAAASAVAAATAATATTGPAAPPPPPSSASMAPTSGLAASRRHGSGVSLATSHSGGSLASLSGTHAGPPSPSALPMAAPSLYAASPAALGGAPPAGAMAASAASASASASSAALAPVFSDAKKSSGSRYVLLTMQTAVPKDSVSFYAPILYLAAGEHTFTGAFQLPAGRHLPPSFWHPQGTITWQVHFSCGLVRATPAIIRHFGGAGWANLPLPPLERLQRWNPTCGHVCAVQAPESGAQPMSRGASTASMASTLAGTVGGDLAATFTPAQREALMRQRHTASLGRAPPPQTAHAAPLPNPTLLSLRTSGASPASPSAAARGSLSSPSLSTYFAPHGHGHATGHGGARSPGPSPLPSPAASPASAASPGHARRPPLRASAPRIYHPDVDGPLELGGIARVGALWWQDGHLEVLASLPRQRYRPGERVFVDVDITNHASAGFVLKDVALISDVVARVPALAGTEWRWAHRERRPILPGATAAHHAPAGVRRIQRTFALAIPERTGPHANAMPPATFETPRLRARYWISVVVRSDRRGSETMRIRLPILIAGRSEAVENANCLPVYTPTPSYAFAIDGSTCVPVPASAAGAGIDMDSDHEADVADGADGDPAAASPLPLTVTVQPPTPSSARNSPVLGSAAAAAAVAGNRHGAVTTGPTPTPTPTPTAAATTAAATARATRASFFVPDDEDSDTDSGPDDPLHDGDDDDDAHHGVIPPPPPVAPALAPAAEPTRATSNESPASAAPRPATRAGAAAPAAALAPGHPHSSSSLSIASSLGSAGSSTHAPRTPHDEKALFHFDGTSGGASPWAAGGPLSPPVAPPLSRHGSWTGAYPPVCTFPYGTRESDPIAAVSGVVAHGAHGAVHAAALAPATVRSFVSLRGAGDSSLSLASLTSNETMNHDIGIVPARVASGASHGCGAGAPASRHGHAQGRPVVMIRRAEGLGIAPAPAQLNPALIPDASDAPPPYA